MKGTATGRLVGALLLPLGGVFWWFAHSMLSSGAPTLRLFTAGPALMLLGVALIVFPGAHRTLEQTRENPQAQREWLTHAPALHKAAWLVSLGVGFVVSRSLGLA